MRTWLWAFVLAACAGDSPPPSDKCMGRLYEPCIEEHDCDSNICQLFAAEAIQVCTVTCDAANPCPDDATCDPNGTCKPAAPAECTQ